MNQQTRLAAETAEEREARLQWMNQQERLAAEMAEERPGYSVDREGHREQQSQPSSTL